MSLHRTCCCGGGGPSRLWLKPSCNDNPPSTVIVFEQNDCNLTLNSQLYEYDDGAFFGALKYCGVLRREVDFPIPSQYQERIVDSTDCGDIEIITCGECYDDLCGYWGGCETPVIVDGYTDTGWQFADAGFGPNTNYRARVSGVNIGSSTWVDSPVFTGWEYEITIDAELETLDVSGCATFPGPYFCDDDVLPLQTYSWSTPFKMRVTCDGGEIVDINPTEPEGPYICENANTRDGAGNPQPYRDVTKLLTRTNSGGSQSSTLNATETECVFEGSWSITEPIDITAGILAADAGFANNWQGCIGITGLQLNTIQLTISGRYGA